MGSCAPTGTLCVAASDLSTSGTCGDALSTFELAPLGRATSTGPNAGGPGAEAGSGATWGASDYPGGTADTVHLDGTSTDSLHFGPTKPTQGVGSL